jgi:Fe-S-cluster containining protein
MEAAAFVVFFVLPCVVLAVLAVGAAVFFKEAFASSASKSSKRATGGPQLPLLAGDALRRWAADLAQNVVARYSALPKSGQNAVALAQEVESKASEVLDLSLPNVAVSRGAVSRRAVCNDCRSEPIRVTAPEALAIAEELRHSLPPYEAQQIYERAKNNVQHADSVPAESSAEVGACPLLAEGGRCSVFSVRPLHCRGRCCPQCDAPQKGSSSTAVPANQFAATFSDGLSEGFSRGLSAAGLDGGSYELNRALVEAIEEPNALERFIRGEPFIAAPPQAV